jgi:hypothetical protein
MYQMQIESLGRTATRKGANQKAPVFTPSQQAYVDELFAKYHTSATPGVDQFSAGNKQVQNLADALANELMLNDATKTVNVHIETPNGNANVNVAKPEKTDIKQFCDESKTNVVEEVPETMVEAAIDTVVLYEVGGMYNPAFYNAALYICETVHFPSCGVYSEDEMTPEEPVKTHILLPNVWGKIFAGAAEEFGEYLKDGAEVFILDPETFELIKINNSLELWDYAMTKVQEESL